MPALYGIDQEFSSALLQVEREALERAGELERRAEDLSADIARLIADLSRERSERARERADRAAEQRQWERAREGLAGDLGRTNARLSDCQRTREILESQLRLFKSAARRLVTAHFEGSDLETDDAAHELRKLLK